MSRVVRRTAPAVSDASRTGALPLSGQRLAETPRNPGQGRPPSRREGLKTATAQRSWLHSRVSRWMVDALQRGFGAKELGQRGSKSVVEMPRRYSTGAERRVLRAGTSVAAASRRSARSDYPSDDDAIQGGFFAEVVRYRSVLDDAQSERDLDEALQLVRALPWPAGESFALWESAAWPGSEVATGALRGLKRACGSRSRSSTDSGRSARCGRWAGCSLVCWSPNALRPCWSAPRAVGRAGVRDVDSAGRKRARPRPPATRTPRRGACGRADSPVAVMSTRLAWAARAELALAQRDSTTALGILRSTTRNGAQRAGGPTAVAVAWPGASTQGIGSDANSS